MAKSKRTGPVTIWKVEFWSYYQGKPGCFDIRYYADKQTAMAYHGKTNRITQPPQSMGRNYQSWVEVYEMVPANPVEVYQ